MKWNNKQITRKVEYASHWMMLDRPDLIGRLLVNFIGQHHPDE